MGLQLTLPKMYIRFAVGIYLLCTTTFGQDKVASENQSNSRDVISEGKLTDSTLKVSVSDDMSNGFSNVDESKNKSFVPAKPKPVDTSLIRNGEEIKSNVTLDGTWHRSSVESVNFGALLRGFYVFLGLSVIVIMYFTVRAIRLGRKKTKVKKYGILASREDVEMTPLGADDEEDDITIFELSSHPGH